MSNSRSGEMDKNLKLAMCRANLAFYAAETLRGPAEPPYNGRFLISRHHQEWADLVNKYDRLCVNAPRDHSKCRVAGSLVLLTDGRRVPVEKLAGMSDVPVLSFNVRTLKFEKRVARVDKASEPVSCVRVRTKTGRVANCTTTHPFLTWDGWRDVKDLSVGDRIAVPRDLGGIGKLKMEPGRAWLLAVVAGDGCMTMGACISKNEASVQEAIKRTVEPWGWTANVSPGKDKVHLSKSYSHDEDSPRNWLKYHGLFGALSRDKRVPPTIFECRDEDIAEYVSGMIDTDCHINLHGGGMIEFSSTSEGLLRDEQHLLLRLGVLSVLTQHVTKYKGEPYVSWKLNVRSNDILRLASWVNPRSEARREALRLVVELQESKSRKAGKCVDLFPRGAWKLVKNSNDWFRRNGFARPNQRYAPTRDKLRRIAEAENNEMLRAVVDAPVLWDEIVEIESIGELPVYPMHVPGLENYVCDDLIDHNSFVFTLAYPIWKAESMPNKKGFIFSASQPQAERILLDITTELETNPKLQHLVPSKTSRKRWAASHIVLANGHEILARGYGTKVRGAHPAYIVADDVLNDEDGYSERVRQKNIDYFLSAITNMIIPGGQIITVGTPYHLSDLYGYLEKNEEYKFVRYSAIIDEGKITERALWPDRYPLEALKRRKKEIGSVRFARELQCRAVNEDSSLFPGSLFRGDAVEAYNVRLSEATKSWKQRCPKGIYFGVDLAISSNVSADWTVIFVMGVDEYGNRWIIDIVRERGLPYNVQLNMIKSIAKRYDPDIIYIEANQMQRIFGDELIRTTDLPIKHFYTTGEGKNSLEKGIVGLKTLLENKKFRIPRGDDRSIELTDMWIAEMQSFSFVNGKVVSAGEHDDVAMASYICEQAVHDTTFSFSFEEQPGDKEAYEEEEAAEELQAELDPRDEDYVDSDAFVLGEKENKRGRPRTVNAQVAENLDLGDEEETYSSGTVGGLRPYSEVAPKLGSPVFSRRRR